MRPKRRPRALKNCLRLNFMSSCPTIAVDILIFERLENAYGLSWEFGLRRNSAASIGNTWVHVHHEFVVLLLATRHKSITLGWPSSRYYAATNTSSSCFFSWQKMFWNRCARSRICRTTLFQADSTIECDVTSNGLRLVHRSLNTHSPIDATAQAV